MRIIKPSVEIMHTGLETETTLPEQFIEKVGRTCYKSEDKITNDSAAKFVGNLVKRGHEAMIEHWSPIFKTKSHVYEEILGDWDTLLHSGNIPVEDRLRPYLRFTDTCCDDGEMRYIISGNMRAWRDYIKAYVNCMGHVPVYLYGLIRNYSIFFPEYQNYVPAVINNIYLIPVSVNDLLECERQVHQDITVKFICDRGVSHEIVRHRVASFAQESTRYCNYGLDKFGNELTVICPSWCEKDTDLWTLWRNGCLQSEMAYFDLLSEGATPQEARAVLPNSLKTEIIVTMNLDGWSHFFELRCANDAHPDIQVVAKMAKEEFSKFI